MALTGVTTPGLDYGDQRASTQDLVDISDVMSQVLLDDTDFLSRIKIGAPAQQRTHYWVEDALNGYTFTLGNATANGIEDGDSTATIASMSASAGWVRAGMIFRNRDQGSQDAEDPELIQVTAVSSAQLTITRGYGGTTASSAHSAADTFVLVSAPKLESADVSDDITRQRTNGVNYTQIFERGLKMSGTTLPIRSAAVPDEWAYQLMMRMKEVRQEMALAVISGHQNSTSAEGSATEGRTLRGIREFVVDGSSTTSAAGADLTEALVNTQCKTIWDAGGFNDPSPDNFVLLCNSFQQQQVSAFSEAKIRIGEDSRKRGLYVNRYLTDLGRELLVVLDRFTPVEAIFILDMNRISLLPLVGRQMSFRRLAATGDHEKGQIVGEYTLEVRNAADAHRMLYYLTTS